MKFTSEDLLKAMGLKVGNKIVFSRDVYEVIGGSYYDCLRRTNGVSTEFLSLISLIDEEYIILQPKPTLTEDEKVILRNLPKEFKYIQRNGKNTDSVFVTNLKMNRSTKTDCWVTKDLQNLEICSLDLFNHLFQFIKWEDEPYSIEELLKE